MRRNARLEDRDEWVFNRMADAYAARPMYPTPLIEEIAARLSGRIADLGAGLGHLALPLAQRGLTIEAIEPAVEMRDRLEERARGLPITAIHAMAEALPFDDASLDAALIADAIHFIDVARTGRELRRTLRHGASLVVVTCEMGETPFMNAVRDVMEESAPRRPRGVDQAIVRLFSIARATTDASVTFEDATPVDHATLARILASISFIGPAMNAERSARFRERIFAISDAPVWSRRFVLHAGCVRHARDSVDSNE